ncbi:Hypothetical protein NTJ_14363 [Nesidiocoris tenuis]|uniref:Protein chibby homolog 1 n=1 Tax=Nesidiocoris tenuis TaxID=355587 RepID=A0ABN7BAY0_9HEMI|nr:Hypothetical protein NTJ_14363 [Nesidiocoris tenuis]
MPLFGKKFCHKKTAARKKLDFHPECPQPNFKEIPVVLNLGENEFVFESGEWKTALEDGLNYKEEYKHLQRVTQELREENNLLKIKLEILLDMLTLETTKSLERSNEMIKHQENDNRAL